MSTPFTIPEKPPEKRGIYHNETDWYIATSPTDASEEWRLQNGEEEYDDQEFGAFNLVPETEVVEVGFESFPDLRTQLQEAVTAGCNIENARVVIPVGKCLSEGLVNLASIHENVAIRAKAEWWAKLPTGFLCSSEW